MGIKPKLSLAAMTLSVAGASFIMSMEGVKTTAYPDPALGKNVPTICAGHTKGVYLGQQATLQQCQQWLVEDTTYAGKAVKRLVKVEVTQEQYDALVSFTYNLGEGTLAHSSLLMYINKGLCKEAGAAFLLYDKAKVNGRLVPLKGLTKRRKGESEKWLSGC